MLDRPAAALGTAGAVVSCAVLIFSTVPAVAGLFGASAASGVTMMGMTMAPTHVTPPWILALGAWRIPILIISLGLLGWGVWRAGRWAQILVAAGMLVLIVNEFHMTDTLFFPALVLLVAGNIIGWWSARRQTVH